MPTRVLSKRLASGKKRKPSRRKKMAGQSRPRRTSLPRLPSRRATHATGLRKSGIQSAAGPSLPAGLSAPSGKAAFAEKPQGLAVPDRVVPDRAPPDGAPEARELKRKRAQLSVFEAELARQERLLSRLRAELDPFEARYFRKVGIRCARLDEIEARIAEIYASIYPDDMAAQDAACRARQRAHRSRNEILRRRSMRNIDPPPALRRLYRAVARRVHPDLGETPADREVRERLMAHANRAYRSGDERRLRAIIAEYEFCPETVQGEGTPAELVRAIRKIAQARRRCEEIQEEMERVRSSELFRFKLLVDSQVKRGRDLFADAVAAANTRIARALAKLKHLEASAAARRGAA
ncbi:MAG TPA: hypothetical protein VNJ52_10855 [Patescibacteria group bacterium]|nr:hypothetical protein [Patescibacteria group bacterium]